MNGKYKLTSEGLPKVAVHCPTQELANRVGKIIAKAGGRDLSSYWGQEKERFMLGLNLQREGNTYGTTDGPGYAKWTHISAEEFLRDNEEIPEKWAVRVNSVEEFRTVLNYLGTIHNDILQWFHLQYTPDSFPYWVGLCRHSFDWFYHSSLQKHHGDEITFDQFKTHILKQNAMERKIVGYKLIKELPEGKVGNTYEWNGASYAPTEGGYTYGKQMVENHPDWFEPVYEEEYKAGDWVWAENCGGNGIRGEGFQLVEIVPSDIATFRSGLIGGWDYVVKQGNEYYQVNSQTAKFRKATPEEIEKAQKILIDGSYEVEFTEKGITIRGESYTKRELKRLTGMLDRHSSQIKSFNCGCTGQVKIDLAILNQILERLEK